MGSRLLIIKSKNGCSQRYGVRAFELCVSGKMLPLTVPVCKVCVCVWGGTQQYRVDMKTK